MLSTISIFTKMYTTIQRMSLVTLMPVSILHPHTYSSRLYIYLNDTLTFTNDTELEVIGSLTKLTFTTQACHNSLKKMC